MQDNKISDLIRSSLEGIKGIVDANTVIGKPIETPSKTVIIPISKVSIGFAGGGNDYAGKHSQAGQNNFGGGGGTGVTITPVGFIAVDCEGGVEILNMNCPGGDGLSLDKIIEKAPDVIEKIKSLFKKKKKDGSENEECDDKKDAESDKSE